ncbi:cofactor assembly of complex C subunit B [Dapis sp. BLCC M229]|uniref:cofactor assembly of complex C subunit B n=1 Tax=Dapis sp. BLCC M229 TaxID=3400188 RepID=UPI003CF57568
MTQSDQNQVLRILPIIAGGLGGTLLMINRFFTPNLLASQARSDVVGVILSAFLILTGLLWQQIQPRSPDTVKLIGESGFELLPELSEIVKTELAWASSLLLTNTVTKTVIIWYQGQVLLRRGILPSESQIKPGAILQRVLEKQKPIYLVDLKVYPGRIEFNYLPENTQGVICQPIGNNGVIILGANAPRSYTKQDENWISGIADKLTDTLSKKL